MSWPEAVFACVFGLGVVFALAWVLVTAIKHPPAPTPKSVTAPQTFQWTTKTTTREPKDRS